VTACIVHPGYSQTSVGDLARETGVAVQTVYSSIGPKPAIVLALVGLIDEEAGLPKLLSRARTESDPRRILAWAVRIPLQFVERPAKARTRRSRF
jgi:AcrR family transcriptional regulator